MIELDEVRFRWHPQSPLILNITNFRVNTGESIFIQGPSGSGKSTLLNKPKGKRNILIIGPQTELKYAERSFMAPALGVIRLAGYLNKKGHYAEAFEPNLPMLTNEGPSLEETLKSKKWDIIGFSILEETFMHDIKNMLTQLLEK